MSHVAAPSMEETFLVEGHPREMTQQNEEVEW